MGKVIEWMSRWVKSDDRRASYLDDFNARLREDMRTSNHPTYVAIRESQRIDILVSAQEKEYGELERAFYKALKDRDRNEIDLYQKKCSDKAKVIFKLLDSEMKILRMGRSDDKS